MNFSIRKQLTLIDSLQFLYQSLNNLAENIKDGQFMLIKDFLVKKYHNGSSKREYVLKRIFWWKNIKMGQAKGSMFLIIYG